MTQKVIELEKINEHLQQLVETHSKELSELSSTNKKFISLIAHDLKNSFNSILGFLVLLKKEIDNHDADNIENYVNSIYNSTYKAYQLLNDLLEWANSQNRKLSLVQTRINLLELVNTEFEVHQEIARHKQITLTHNIPSFIEVKADVHMVKTILRNLLNNALKFSYRGGKILVSVTIAENFIIVAVKDYGVGILPEIKDKLFKIDGFIPSVGTENEKGTGLGLFLCKEFVEIQGGNIWFESKSGKGSEFSFSLPQYS